MSAIAIKTILTVGVAEPIRLNAELHSAVKKATEYLEELLDAPEMQVDQRELRWGYSETSPPEIIAHLAEWDRYGHRQAQFTTTANRLRDPVSRDVSMGRLASQLLRQKYFQIGTVIDRGIKELELEEQRSGDSD